MKNLFKRYRSSRVKNCESLPAHLDAKLKRFDVHVTFNDGESADLEMQICLFNNVKIT